MQNLTIYFIFYFLLSKFLDTVLVIFVGIVFIVFVGLEQFEPLRPPAFIDFLKFGNKYENEFFFRQGGVELKGGIAQKGGKFFTFILDFHKKEEYRNDFQFV